MNAARTPSPKSAPLSTLASGAAFSGGLRVDLVLALLSDIVGVCKTLEEEVQEARAGAGIADKERVQARGRIVNAPPYVLGVDAFLSRFYLRPLDDDGSESVRRSAKT